MVWGCFMNIIFYSESSSQLVERCLSILRHDCGLYDTIVLPTGCRLECDRCLELRSGDIMILFSANRAELNSLLALRPALENFRIILLTATPCAEECQQRVHLLAPRYITTIDDIQGIRAVIKKMLLHSRVADSIRISCTK